MSSILVGFFFGGGTPSSGTGCSSAVCVSCRSLFNPSQASGSSQAICASSMRRMLVLLIVCVCSLIFCTWACMSVSFAFTCSATLSLSNISSTRVSSVSLSLLRRFPADFSEASSFASSDWIFLAALAAELSAAFRICSLSSCSMSMRPLSVAIASFESPHIFFDSVVSSSTFWRIWVLACSHLTRFCLPTWSSVSFSSKLPSSCSQRAVRSVNASSNELLASP
mmetsp:Transcript_30708/g.41567  ORF Transcript_30708/g.41567 Transcript_30708/m.41567 type:complete len:224 (-) Transcript_30708:363-1034(-)